MEETARKWLIDRAIDSIPFEACGFVLETGELIEVQNVSPTPTKHFRMDREELVEQLRLRPEFITGIWHTHPRGNPNPSQHDLYSMKIGAVQRNWDYYIATPNGVWHYQPALYAPQEPEFWARFKATV